MVMHDDELLKGFFLECPFVCTVVIFAFID